MTYKETGTCDGVGSKWAKNPNMQLEPDLGDGKRSMTAAAGRWVESSAADETERLVEFGIGADCMV